MLDVAGLAAIDIAANGRRLIIVEFAFGVIGCLLLGAISLRSGLMALSHGPVRRAGDPRPPATKA